MNPHPILPRFIPLNHLTLPSIHLSQKIEPQNSRTVLKGWMIQSHDSYLTTESFPGKQHIIRLALEFIQGP